MGWLDTPEERRRQHIQMIAKGNIKDLDRIHERDRARSINLVFWFLLIIGALFCWNRFNVGAIQDGFYSLVFSFFILVILIVRYGLHKNINIGRNSNGWQRINELPGWAYRRMNRKHKNRVRGEHYIYKREGNNFYRRLK